MARRRISGIQKLIIVVFGIGALVVSGLAFQHSTGLGIGLFIVIGVVGVLLAASIRVADQWEKAAVLRLGKFQALAGPGLLVASFRWQMLKT